MIPIKVAGAATNTTSEPRSAQAALQYLQPGALNLTALPPLLAVTSGVDGANPTGAVRLYEGLGFERDPGRDWQFEPGQWLYAYRLEPLPPPNPLNSFFCVSSNCRSAVPLSVTRGSAAARSSR